MTDPIVSLGNSATALVDSAAQSADQAIRASQRLASSSLGHLADRVDGVRAQAGSALSSLASEAEHLKQRGIDAAREGSQRVSEQAQRMSASTVGYIRDEPVKSVLIAAAVGATLMALITLASRSGGR